MNASRYPALRRTLTLALAAALLAGVCIPVLAADTAGPAPAMAVTLMAESFSGTLPSDLQLLNGGRPAVTLRAFIGDTLIEDWTDYDDLQGVSIPYTLKEEDNPSFLFVCRLEENGLYKPVPDAAYCDEHKAVHFTTYSDGVFAVVSSHVTFDDLGASEWARTAIETLASRAAVYGRVDSYFEPSAPVLRDEFIDWLVRTLNLDAVPASNFDDACHKCAYYHSLGVAKTLGLVSGIGSNLFGVGDDITRQDMMVMLYNALTASPDYPIRPAGAAALDAYGDGVSVTSYARVAAATMVSTALISGRGGGLIAPRGTTSRAEAAAVLYKVYQKNYWFKHAAFFGSTRQAVAVTGAQAAALVADEGATVVDVRPEGSYASGHIAGSLSIPYAVLAGEAGVRLPDRARPLILYCSAGATSAQAAKLLLGLGYERVYDLGAVSNWAGGLVK